MIKLSILKSLPLFLSFLFVVPGIIAQNITNTLGTNGTFTVKDASVNLFTISQSTGQVSIPYTLKLENTTGSGVGVLYMGNSRFMHNIGGSNMFLGERSGNFTIGGQFNTGVGAFSLTSLTTGSYNSALGYGSLSSNTTGKENTACGMNSLAVNSTGSYNSAFGSLCMRNNTTGSYNSAFGFYAMLNNTTGIENSAFGCLALTTNTGGNWNAAFGNESLLQATMNFNTAIGNRSGTNITTGSGVICIGYNSQPSSGNAVNQLTLGNNQITSLRCAVTTITSLSDRRDKKNINDLELGISFLMKIKPRLFNWDKREWYENNISDGSKMQEEPTAGFIAQELDQAQTEAGAEWLNLILKDNPEKFEAMAGNLLPVIVKALQELKIQNDSLKNVNAELKSKNKNYTKILSKLKKIQEAMESEVNNLKSLNKNDVLKVVKGEDQ